MHLTLHDFIDGSECMEGHQIIGMKERIAEEFHEVCYLPRLDIEPQNGTFYVADENLGVNEEETHIFMDKCKALDTLAIAMKSRTFLHDFVERNPLYKKCMHLVVTPSLKSSESIYIELMRQANSLLRSVFQNVNDINIRFFRMSLKNDGIEAMISYFKEVIGNPVAIFDENFQFIIATDDCLRTHGIIKSTSENIYLNNLYFSKQKISLAGSGEYSLISFPISFQGKVRAYLSILEQNSIIGNVDYLVLEIAASSILLEMKHSFSIKVIQERNINNFLYDLFYREEKHMEEFCNLAVSLGFLPDADFFVMIMEAHAGAPKYTAPRTLSNVLGPTVSDEVFSLISNEINVSGACMLLGQLGSHVIALCRLGENHSETFEKIRKRINKIVSDINIYFQDSVLYTGVGSIARGITQAVESYKNAQSALVYARMISKKDESMTIIYQDNMLIRLLSRVGSREQLDEIIPKGLKDLYEYDLVHQTRLFATLSMYIECDCNARLASERMFIHYKTMLYRLNKIMEIGKCSFSNSDEKMHITLGLAIMKLLQLAPFEK